MSACRAAWQALAARLATAPLLRTPALLPHSANTEVSLLGGVIRSGDPRWLQNANGTMHAPLRRMSSGSVPGSSGENLIYYLFAGVACTAGGYYAYRTVTSDKKRYNERIHAIQQSNTAEWKPKPWPPQGDEMETVEVTEESMQATEVPTEEAEELTADESTEQNERSMVSTEAEVEKELPVADASSAVEEVQQEAAASLEATQVQEVVGEGLDVAAASTHEDYVDSIQEGTATAAQEMLDTSSRNQKAVADESWQDSEGSSATTGSQEIPKNP